MRILVIPDTQVKPGIPTEHLEWAGRYAVDQEPDVIVMIGDWWDMPSLSTFEQKGSKYWEGKTYKTDIAAGNAAMDLFMAPILAEVKKQSRRKAPWNPRLVFTLGNHEQRIERALNADPKAEGMMSYDDFNLKDYGWEVYPFLEPVIIEGVAFCHYFTSGVMGRCVTSASAMLNKKLMSCVQGHVQDRDFACRRRADGKQIIGLFAGIFYQHDEDYLDYQTNQSWRGIWVLHEVNEGSFDEMPVSINYLRNKYGRSAA